MEQTRLNKLLSRIVDIKPSEEKLAVLLFACFFLITCPHTIIKALRYADLLWKLGTGGLPVAYLLAAVVTGLVVLFQSRKQSGTSSQLMITVSLIFFVITGLLIHLLLLTEYGKKSVFLSYFYWVWASVLIIMLLTQFWLIINEVFNPREAKRLIGFCGSGGILGGIVGGLLARFLTKANLANLLLPLALVLLFACIFAVRAVFIVRKKKLIPARPFKSKKEMSEIPRVGFRDSFDAVRKNKYLVLISGLVIISVIISTFIDFQFSSAVDDNFYTKEAKQAFFGLFYAIILTISFFLNLFLTPKILRNFRPRFTLMFTPSVLFLCCLGVLFMPFTLLPAVFIKGSDESLGFSLNQSMRELLYIPVVSDLKVRAKPFIDMFINRFAKVIAAILLLLFAFFLEKEVDYLTPVFDPDLSQDLIWGIIILLVVWVIIGIRIEKEYKKAITEKIKRKWPNAYKDVADKLDIDYTKLVFDTIESKKRSSVLYAMHLFDLLERDKLSPEIKKMISQTASEVTASSFGNLFNAEGATWFPEIDDEITQENFITNIREVMSSEAYQHVMRLYIESMMEKSETSEIEKMEIAKAIGLMNPDAPLVKRLSTLISDDSPEVSCYAIRSAAKLKQVEHIPAIIQTLSNPKTHEDAVSALKEYGHSATSTLEEYLCDSEKDIRLRKAVVKVLANIVSQKQVRILLRELDQKTEGLDREVIDALDRMRSEQPDFIFPTKVAKRATVSIIKKYCQTFVDLENLESLETNEELKRRMERNLEIQFMDIFKLLGLYYPHEDIVKAFQNLKTGTQEAIAYAIELLDLTLKKDMKDFILPLIEDLSPSERLRKFLKILKY